MSNIDELSKQFAKAKSDNLNMQTQLNKYRKEVDDQAQELNVLRGSTKAMTEELTKLKA